MMIDGISSHMIDGSSLHSTHPTSLPLPTVGVSSAIHDAASHAAMICRSMYFAHHSASIGTVVVYDDCHITTPVLKSLVSHHNSRNTWPRPRRDSIAC